MCVAATNMKHLKTETISPSEESSSNDQPAALAIVAMLYSLWAVLTTVTGGFMVLSDTYFGLSGLLVLGIGSIVFFVGIFGLVIAWSLWNRVAWSRWIAVLCVAIGLMGLPVGTILSFILLWYLLKPGIKQAFY